MPETKARCYWEYCCNVADHQVVIANRSGNPDRPAIAWGWCWQHKHLAPVTA